MISLWTLGAETRPAEGAANSAESAATAVGELTEIFAPFTAPLAE